MKELSIEEKAKAYDKALAIARDFYNSTEYAKSHAEVKATYEAIFPELKESEDERVELLNYLYDVHDDDEERARWIAWLEKQGEQKPAWSEEDEKMLKELVRFIPQHLTSYSYKEYYNWAVSHRPQKQWKPSEEQIRILELAIDYWKPNDVSVTTPLYNLLEQLKKLMLG